MTFEPPKQPEMIERYGSPEFFITHIAKAELIDGPCVRLYCCATKDNAIELQYTVVIPLSRIAAIGRQCLSAAAELHNKSQWVADSLS
jgi:hypothetical protein